MSRFSDPICLSFHECLLRLSDIELLQGPHWLNDQIISFYFEYLEKYKFKTNNDILFISPEVTQCLKIVPDLEDLGIFLQPLDAYHKKFIFFPLNNNETHKAGGTHWSLLVFSRAERTFYHFDSAGTSNLHLCQQFVQKIKESIGCSNAICKSIRCLQQTNSYDCGIHVICMTDLLSEHANRYDFLEEGSNKLGYDIVKRKRADILRIISSLGGKF